MWLQTVKFIVEKSKCAGLAQEIGFSSPNSCSLPWLAKGATQLCTSKRTVINCTGLRLSVSDWLVIMIGPGGLLLVVPTYMQFQFYWWSCQKKEAKLRDLILLSTVTYWTLVEMHLLLCCIISHLIVFFTLYYILVYPMQLLPSVHKFHTNHVVKNSSYVI